MYITYPLLAIAVLQVIVIWIIPIYTQSNQKQGQESILSKDYKVSEESTNCLHHPYKKKKAKQTQNELSIDSFIFNNHFIVVRVAIQNLSQEHWTWEGITTFNEAPHDITVALAHKNSHVGAILE